ncbi:MAG: hypothetical protein VKP57_08235 [Candidatus Sericytochromatia bacterium]|nr:hypothetical protein [Candidatus Sericytochromatia bacterium]
MKRGAFGFPVLVACLLLQACTTVTRLPVVQLAAPVSASAPVLPRPAADTEAARLEGNLKVPVLAAARSVQAGIVPEMAGPGTRPTEEVAGTEALVYLTDPEGRLVSFEGQTRIATTVDGEGRFRFVERLPVGRPLFLTALLPGDRRLVGFVVTRPGDNTVSVSLASTCVAHLLALKARVTGRDLASYPASALLELTEQTRARMKSGHLPVPDLTIGHDLDVVHGYVAAMAGVPSLRGAWGTLLGSPLVPATTVFRDTEDYVTAAGYGAGHAYWSHSSRIYRVPEAGGAVDRVLGADADEPAPPSLPEEGSAAGDAVFGPIRFAVDALGDLAVHAEALAVVGFVPAADGVRFGRPVRAGHWYRLLGTGEMADGPDDADGRDSAVMMTTAMAWDDRGGLYLLDAYADRIRHLRGEDGQVTGVVRLASADATGSAFVSGLLAGEVQGHSGLAWRRLPDGREQLFTASVDRQRIMVLTQPGPGSWAGVRLLPLAGSGRRGFAGDGGAAAEAAFDFPPAIASVPLALDASGSRLVVADVGNARLRAIDLGTGIIRTVAGGGDQVGDGEALALRLRFQQPEAIAVGADGSIYMPVGGESEGLRIWPVVP